MTSEEEFIEAATDTAVGTRIPIEVRVEVDDPYEAYRRCRDSQYGVYFETGGPQSGWGHFATGPVSFLSVSPEEVTEQRGSLDALEEFVRSEDLNPNGCEVPYPCGAFGWLSYDIARELEDLPDKTVDDRGLPRLQFGLYDRVASWRADEDGPVTLRVTCCPRIDEETPLERQYEDGRQRAASLATAALSGQRGPETPPKPATRTAFTNDISPEAFAERVERVKEYIRDGDTFQANISQRLTADAGVHPIDVFAALREINPAPYSGVVEFPEVTLVTTSPELLLDVDGEQLITEPIAGTRPRGQTTVKDDRLERELLEDEKERAEHAMLVDLERNDMGKVCEHGSVTVDDYRRIDRYSEVMHTVSVVEGRRADDVTLSDEIEAVFPGGTITGAPKPRTMEIIDEMEDTRRGPYTGSIGVIGFNEKATLNMVIRTLVQTNEQYYLRVGAGIVHDSVPHREYEETLDKGRALLSAVDEALSEERSVEVSIE